MQRIAYRYLFTLCAEFRSKEYDVTRQPHEVTFRNGDTLNVELQIQNVWKYYKQKDVSYALYLLDEIIEPLSTTTTRKIKFKRTLFDSWGNTSIRLCLSSRRNLTCDMYQSNIIHLKFTNEEGEKEDGDCLGMRPCILKIKLEKNHKVQEDVPTAAEESTTVGYKLQTSVENTQSLTIRPAQEGRPKPQISILGGCFPKDNPREDHYYAIVSCTSRVQDYDLLYLFQNQDEGPPHVLKMEQHLPSNRTDEMTLIMNKTLQDSDKEHKVYCVKQSINDSMDEVKSKEIRLMDSEYEDFFEPLKPAHVSVEPTFVWFDPNSTLSFICNGTPPVEGRGLNWYIQDTNTEIQVPESSNQQYDHETNVNNLTLLLTESFHLKTLFCAEDFFLPVKYLNKTQRIIRYGVRATSKIIELRWREERKFWGLIWGLMAGVLVTILVLIALLVIRARRRRCVEQVSNNETDEENTYDNSYACSSDNYYVTPQVQYAVLDLPERNAASQNGAPTGKTSYVKIVGVYNPRK